MHAFEIRVRYGDTDPMGWAYYGHYLRWFEIGRAEMLRALGRSYRSVEEEDGVLLPVLEAHCLYLRGARYDEAVRIETGVLDRARAVMRFGYRVRGEGGDEVAAGWTTHCFMDRGGRPRRPTPALARLLAAAPDADAALRARLAGGRAAAGAIQERKPSSGFLSMSPGMRIGPNDVS